MPTAAPAAPATNGTAPEKPPRDATQQLSYSGTPRGSDGLTSPDDYNRDMADLGRRMEIFEEMGASDDAIGIALEQRTLEVLAANWQLTTADESDLGAQILEFGEDNFYPHLENLLRWLAADPMQYGFVAIEPVFAWSDAPFATSIARGEIMRPTRAPGERRLYLRRVAHIRQTAVTGFTIDDNGELVSLLQEVFDGKKFRREPIPAEKLLLRTYRRKGDDYSGVPAIRCLYKGFNFKRQIERLTVLHFDKFGVGVPVITEPPQGFTPTERALALQAAINWSSGGDRALILPNGGTAEIVTAEGALASAGLEWSKYYNGQSSKALVTQQTELGSTETGSRAVGDTFSEQLGGASQSDCEDIASLLNALLVKLVKWNFGPQDVYPTFNPSQRSKGGAADFASIKEAVDSKLIHPRPEDEVEIRDRLELPAVDLATLKQEQTDRDAQAAEIAKAAGAQPGQPPDDKGKGAPPKPPLKVAATQDLAGHVHALAAALAEGAPAPAVPGQSSYRTREFSQWEQEILRPDVLVRDLDMSATRLASEVQDVLKAIDEDLHSQVTALAGRGVEALSDGVKKLVVPDKLKAQLRAVMLAAAQRTRDYGGEAVRKEIIRQIGPTGIGPQRDAYEPMGFFTRALRTVIALAQAKAPRSPFDLHLEAEVDRVVEDEIDRREKSARSSVLTAIASAAAAAVTVLVTVVSSAIKKALESLSMGTTESNVKGVVNVAFGIGRTEQAQAINAAAGAAIPAAERAQPVGAGAGAGAGSGAGSSAAVSPPSTSGTPVAVPRVAPAGGGGGGNRSGLVDAQGTPIELVAKVYSAVMDFGTCDECAKWDGGQFPIDYAEDYTGVQCPNPRCFGGYSKCRCIWLYLTSLESVPLVPAAKGPLAA